MVISQAPAQSIAFQDLAAGIPFRFVTSGPVLIKSDMSGWHVGKLIDLASGHALTDEPSPVAACYPVNGEFVEFLPL